MIILSMIETTSRCTRSLIMIRPSMFKLADGCGEEASAQNNQNWGFTEAKCLVEIWANEGMLRQLSAMGIRQNI